MSNREFAKTLIDQISEAKLIYMLFPTYRAPLFLMKYRTKKPLTL